MISSTEIHIALLTEVKTGILNIKDEIAFNIEKEVSSINILILSCKAYWIRRLPLVSLLVRSSSDN